MAEPLASSLHPKKPPVRPTPTPNVVQPELGDSNESGGAISPPVLIYSKSSQVASRQGGNAPTHQVSSVLSSQPSVHPSHAQCRPPPPFHWNWASDFIKRVGWELRSLQRSSISVRIWGDLSLGIEKGGQLESESVDLGVIVTSSDPMTPSCLSRIFSLGRVARVLLVFTTSSNGLTLQHGFHPAFTKRSYCCSGNQIGWAGEVLGRVVGSLGREWGEECVRSTIKNWGEKSGIAGGLFVTNGRSSMLPPQPSLPPPPPSLAPQQITTRSPREQGGKSPKRRAVEMAVVDVGRRSISPSTTINSLSITGGGASSTVSSSTTLSSTVSSSTTSSSSSSSSPTPNFYELHQHPDLVTLGELIEHTKFDILLGDLKRCVKEDWHPWPEGNLQSGEGGWTVWPICHTLPVLTGETIWLEQALERCGGTVNLLKRLGAKTALFSRLAPGESLKPHRGWAELSNHVLRCHILLTPITNASTVTCGGEVRSHEYQKVLIFDDSKIHHATNGGDQDRFVLIVDIPRPPESDGIGKGEAEEGYTDDVREFVARFK